MSYDKWDAVMIQIVRESDDNLYISRMSDFLSSRDPPSASSSSNQVRHVPLVLESSISSSMPAMKQANTFISSATMPAFPYKEGGEQPSLPAWEQYLNDIESYESNTGLRYDRAGLLFQREIIKQIMSVAAQRCTSVDEKSALTHWEDCEVLPTAKYKAAFLSIIKSKNLLPAPIIESLLII